MKSKRPWQHAAAAGDSALMLDFGEEISPEINERVQQAFRVISTANVLPVVGLIPGFSSLLVEFSPAHTAADLLEEQLAQLDYQGAPTYRGRTIEIPTWYGGEAGPDLVEVSRQLGLTPNEVVERHTGTPYRIYCIGFAPGFPLAGILPAELRLPRRSVPRTRVPAGSVAIAGAQTGIYPTVSPGGWHLIGRTPGVLFDWAQSQPCIYQPGDSLRFRSISEAEYRDLVNRL